MVYSYWGEMKSNYNRKLFAEVLKKTGIKKGDVIFSHSNIGFFGIPGEGKTAEQIFKTVLAAFQDVIGQEGTLVVPTFTLSFCKLQSFDPDNTPSFCGVFSEKLRQLPESCRSEEPLFSVSALGKLAKKLTDRISDECFGKDSFWERFLNQDGVICNMNLDAGSTFIHYVERCLNVPYRYDKLFTGTIIKNGMSHKSGVIFFCQDLSNTDTVACFELFDKLSKEWKVARSASIGRGGITIIRASDVYNLIKKEIKKNLWFLTVAGKQGRGAILIKNITINESNILLNTDSSMEEIIQKLWRLPRELISDGYDIALFSLEKVIDMKIHKYPTGTKCWTWIIPEKWICHEASLETLDGRKVFDYRVNPLHCVSYSLPFEEVVSKEVLLKHLHTHPHIPEAVPYIFKPYERDWGLCCSQVIKNSLTEEEYKVVIKTKFSYGELKVGEIIIPGESEESFILCAHLCHTYMTNDDLAGVAVGLEVMRRLKAMKKFYYTYRFLIVPETIGSIAWLSQNEKLIPKVKGGLFLEVLGRDTPHSLQLSFHGNTQLDRCFALIVKSFDSRAWIGKFCTVIQNDEKQFNAPGVRIPMLSLSRVDPPDSKTWPYREYHSDYDNLSNISSERLEESCELVLKMLENFEKNLYVVNKYKGEIFCSRYGIYIDFYTNPKGHQKLIDLIHLIDGSRTVTDLTQECSLTIEECMGILDKLKEKDLIYFSRIAVKKHFI